MKMKFFERSYLITLILFLLFFNGGIFSLVYYTYHNNSNAEIQVARSEQYLIREAYEQDHNSGGKYKLELLQSSYGDFYHEKGIMLCFERGGEITFSNIPSSVIIPNDGTIQVLKIEEKKHILISELICENTIMLTYAKDISHLDDELRGLMLTFSFISIIASSILAILLYYVQRKLFEPLKKLRDITKDISSGNFAARADDSGKDEFAELAQDFNAMTDKINEQMNELKSTAEQKQMMLDNIAHELRTPLTTIYGYAEYAHNVKLKEEDLLKAMRKIMSESKRLKNIGDTLLDSAFIREKGINRKNVSIGRILLQTIERFKLRAGDAGVELRYVGGNFEILGDETLLEIVLSNLTENAIRACRSDGVIELGADEVSKSFFVKDNGIGLNEEQLKHLTEPFYRTDTSRNRNEGGTGLGLALCRLIAEAHDAKLCFESVINVGTTASFVFENGGEDIEK